jgi:DMSO reductase anchor subunit
VRSSAWSRERAPRSRRDARTTAIVKPALSVILFTVLSGAGLGALALVALAELGSRAAGETLVAQDIAMLAATAGLALVVAGLCASTLHLANPRNAWRSLARWRTSWLSREALAALVLLPLAFAWIVLLHVDAMRPGRALLALLAIVLAWATLYCTAMIYASLKPIRQWHTRRVPLAYFVLGHMSGAIVVVAMLRGYGEASLVAAVVAGVLVVLSVAVKLDYYAHVASDRGRLTIEDAIGVAHGVGPPNAAQSRMRARLLDAGHSGSTFLTHEFGYTLAPPQRVALRTLFWCAGIAVPALWLAIGLDDWHGATIATVVCLAGLAAERWLFFAEARHTVRLYHGDPTT